MTSLWEMPAVVVVLLSWLASPPTSMADAARHETVRRLLTAKSTAAYSNDNLPEARQSDYAPSANSVGASPAVEPEDESRPAQPAASPNAQGGDRQAPVAKVVVGDEKSWRDLMTSLASILESDELIVAGLQSRITSLQNDFVARDDPAQRAALGQELAKTLNEFERMKGKVQADRAAIEKARDDARRQGVPPGWVR